eukprot:714879_1
MAPLPDAAWASAAIVFPLLAGITLVLFWRRREIQPIKARHPTLVLLSGIALSVWPIILAFQRIYSDDFPCWLHLWTAYVGTAIVLSVYVVRAFFLYANYNLTSFMSEARKRYVKQLQKDRRKNVKQRREFEALTVKYPTGFDQFQNDEFDAGRVSNNSNASSEGGGSNAEEANRALTVDVKEVNKQLWYRMHARLLKKHAFAKIL